MAVDYRSMHARPRANHRHEKLVSEMSVMSTKGTAQVAMPVVERRDGVACRSARERRDRSSQPAIPILVAEGGEEQGSLSHRRRGATASIMPVRNPHARSARRPEHGPPQRDAKREEAPSEPGNTADHLLGVRATIGSMMKESARPPAYAENPLIGMTTSV